MGYLSIPNLYKEQTILLMKECWALEKVHGTSAHISYKIQPDLSPVLPESVIKFFSGGEKHEKFVALFDLPDLYKRFIALGHAEITVYGEAYGGKCQGMSSTYGPDLRFIVFDVKISDAWLDVLDAHDVASKLDLEFVPYEKVSTELSELDRMRDLPSRVAMRHGMGDNKVSEGVVLRPLTEMTDKRGNRIICKHKGDKFSERATPQKVVDPAKLQVLKDAQAIADEWVVPMRLDHVLQKMPEATDMSHTSKVIKAMVEDVRREAAGEIIESPDVMKAISRKASELWKKRITTVG